MKHILNRRLLSIILLLFTKATYTIAQKFSLPQTPVFDSIYIDKYNEKILEKSFYLKGKKVFKIGYNTGSMLYTPFEHIGNSKEDSCYAYFTGEDKEVYDFYYMSDVYIINKKYAENSKVLNYVKFTWDNKLIEKGNYYFIKELFGRTISHCKKYKIGKWITYDSLGKPEKVIDYDNLTINGYPITFEGNMEIIDSLRNLAENRIINVYGNDFFREYIHFNLDMSGYYENINPRPGQPAGRSLLEKNEKEIKFVDLSYDIVIDQERFNIIHFRISRNGEFLGRTYFPNFAQEYYYLTQGLDTLNNGKFHKSIIKWKRTATKVGLNTEYKGFNIRFEYQPESDYYGALWLILEQKSKSTYLKYSFSTHVKQYRLNPWTGEIIEIKEK